MSTILEINIDVFCSMSGISISDKDSLILKHGLETKKTYTDWFSIIEVDYNIPNDLRKHFKAEFNKVKEVVPTPVLSEQQEMTIESKIEENVIEEKVEEVKPISEKKTKKKK